MGRWGSANFDGLKKLDQSLNDMRSSDLECILRETCSDLSTKLMIAAKKNTPVGKTGRLVRGFKISDVMKKSGMYSQVVSNDVSYARPVEFGHKRRGGNGFVVGRFMLKRATDDAKAQAPTHAKKALRGFLGDRFNDR